MAFNSGTSVKFRLPQFDTIVASIPMGMMVLAVMVSSGCASFHQSTVANRLAADKLTARGVEALRQGQPAKAARYLREATHQKPDDVYCRVQLAEALVSDGDPVAAINELQQALEKSPSQYQLYVRLGELHFAQGQILVASHHTDRAIELNRQSGPAWQLRGDIQRVRGDTSAALASYQHALGLLKQSPELQMRIAQVYQQQNQPLRALATMEQLVQQYPTHDIPCDVSLFHAAVLLDANQPGRSADLLTQLAKRDDAPAETFIFLSAAHWHSQQSDQCRDTLLQAQARFPDTTIFADLLQQIPVAGSLDSMAGR